MKSEDAPELDATTFGQWLADYKTGTVDVEVMMALKELVNGVRDFNKKGSVTLQIEVAPSEIDGAYSIRESVAAKIPEETRTKTLYFAADDGTPVKHNPAQDALPFGKSVDQETGEVQQ